MPRLSKKSEIQAYARERNWDRVGQQHWEELRARYPESTIRTALAEVAVAIDQPFAGVRSKSMEELETSLIEMAQVYGSHPQLRQACRAQVIAAKDRARFASRNATAAPEKRAVKKEMVEWMLVWLGDPGMFATWAALRKRASYCSSTDST